MCRATHHRHASWAAVFWDPQQRPFDTGAPPGFRSVVAAFGVGADVRREGAQVLLQSLPWLCSRVSTADVHLIGQRVDGGCSMFMRSDGGREAAGRAVASAGRGPSHDHGLVANQTVTAAVAVSPTLSVI